jgi:hypothetical protein
MDVLLAGNDSSHWEGSRTGGDVQRRPPVENIPGQAEQRSAAARKLFGFGPESCSPSARNPVRDQRGILFGFTPESRSPCPGFRIHVELAQHDLLEGAIVAVHPKVLVHFRFGFRRLWLVHASVPSREETPVEIKPVFACADAFSGLA